MPNTRRRKFSVQNNIAKRDSNKMQNGIQCNQSDPVTEVKAMSHNLITAKSNKSRYKASQNTFENTTSSEVVADFKSAISTLSIKKQSTTTIDKDVTASSSNIDLFNVQIMGNDNASFNRSKESVITQIEIPVKTNDIIQTSRDITPWRQDKHPREHRVKVRSPKRRLPIYVNNNNESNIQTTGTVAINWDEEMCNNVESTIIETESAEGQDRSNDNSIDDMCRICHGGDGLSLELGPLISACSCRGTVGRVHVKCLERWLTESGKSRCELCGTRYLTKRIHKYGVPRALVMWILSQNAKQLMVDSLGIMLMSPLAVLAAWLSGRTLAGLMTQDSRVTPWPLASTFVLACMTLVCYYCWIVSAATRHAIGWWIWYRSQYEVRLQLQENDN